MLINFKRCYLSTLASLFFGTKKLLLLIRLIPLSVLTGSFLLGGCIPSLEKSYLTPQVQGQLVYFNPTGQPPFTAVADAKIYYQAYPDQIVYSDQQGRFQLPAITKTTVKLLMAGHALARYPIIIEQKGFSDTVLATATLSMRSLEVVDLGTVIVADTNQSLPPHSVSANPASCDTTTCNSLDPENKTTAPAIKKNNHKAHTTTWPCDIYLTKSLHRSIKTAQRLTTWLSKPATMHGFEHGYAAQHFQHTQTLLEAVENSCQWPAISTAAQQETRQQALSYFLTTSQWLDSLSANQKK